MTEADKELSELLDSTLEYFRGNKTVRLDNFRELYKDELHKFYPVENAFNILQGDGLINCLSTGYVLLPKGFGVLAHINQLGYVAKYNERFKKEQPVVQISESLLFDKPTIHKVITTPNRNESNNGNKWYSKPLFTYIIWPLLVGLIILSLTLYFS